MFRASETEPQGQCHRKQTAAAKSRIDHGKGETVRQERTALTGNGSGTVNPTGSKTE